MNNFPGMGSEAFAPDPADSIRELLWKAEGMLEYLRENESFLRKFPTGAVDEKRANWKPLAELLHRAVVDPELEVDARLEAERVWAEEVHHSALCIITMCVHARSEAARKRFTDDPEELEDLIEGLEGARPAAMRVIPKDELDELRTHGFLRPGE